MQSKVGEIYEGKVTGMTAFGAFVKLSNGETGMVHISEVAPVSSVISRIILPKDRMSRLRLSV